MSNATEQRARAMLGDLAGASARCDAADANIRKGAAARLDAVNKRMDELRPTALTDGNARDEYQGLVVERARLSQVVMRT